VIGAVRDAWREEVEAVVAMHLDARARLVEELTGHRDAHDHLRSVLAEKDGAAESLRVEMKRLTEEADVTREAHGKLQALLAERGGSEEALRKELERLAGDAGEAREAHDRLKAALGEKEKMEEAVRQELERLRDEAAGRRKAEEAHEGLRVQLGERDQREESLRGELARLRGDKEFLDGVIDGSPVGIFAHDREGRCRVWNAALERLLNRARTEALGRTTAELFPPVEGRDGAEDEPPSGNGDVRAVLPSEIVLGRSEFFESSHAPVRDAAGEVVGGMTLVRQLPRPASGEPAPPIRDGAGAHQLAVTPRKDADWLGFN
jgi:PAS domain-containing protein